MNSSVNLRSSKTNIRLPPKWIELNIMKKECTTFIASPNTEELVCQCGRRKVDHGDFAKHQHRPETWSPTIHTRSFSTDAYGTILFEAEHHPNKAHYVRLSYDTNPETIVQLMTYVWNLDMPQLVISVRGGSTNFEMSPRLGKIFQTGIIKAVRSTNAWVFSNGLNSGAAKHLGIALGHEKWLGGPRRGRVVSVGIAPWGMIENRSELLGRNKERTYSPLDHANSKFLQLNSRHSNFLLVDNGSVGKFGGENYLRRRLEKCIASYPTSPQRGCDIPVVVIVLEGGFYTLRQISDYLYDEPPIPVVVFAGTGRSADLIAWVLKRVDTMQDYDDMKDQIYEKIMHYFRIHNENQCSMLYEEMRNIFYMQNYVTVYNPNATSAADEDFDAVILSSIFRSQHWTPLEQLSLTLVWNRVDIAQAEVFIYGREWTRDHLEHAMMEALVSNRLDFVTLLLEHGLNIQTFLTASRLEALYSLDRIPSKLLRTLLVQLSKLHINKGNPNHMPESAPTSFYPGRNLTIHDIGIALSHMIGHVYKSSYIHVVAKIHKTGVGAADESEVRAQTFNQPFDDLFVWAVLTSRHELSKLLWRHGKGALAKALIATKINKFLAATINAQERAFTNIAVDFEHYAEEWESISLSLLDSCYRVNSKMARQLLTMELEVWSKQTCLTLAVMANHRTMLGHPCCQQLLADLWMGALNIKTNSPLKIILGVIFPPIAFFWEYKSTEELRLLPHQGKSGNSLNIFASQEGLIPVTGRRSVGGGAIRTEKRDNAHDPGPGILKSDSSLMTLLLQNRKSDEIGSIGGVLRHPPTVTKNEAKWEQELKEDEFRGLKHRVHFDDLHESVMTEERDTRLKVTDHCHPSPHHFHHHHHHRLFKTGKTTGVGTQTMETNIESRYSEHFKGHSFVTTHQSLGMWRKFVEFQFAPVSNFYRHLIAYLIFILAFSYVILYPQNRDFPGYVEWYVIAYFATMFLECIRAFLEIDALSLSEKLSGVKQNIWQFGDLIVVSVCLFGGVVGRFFAEYYDYGMLIYRLSSIYWNLRLYKYIGVHRFLGPKIVMIRRMIMHMVHFGMIIVVVIISFGIAREAIRFPNNKPSFKSLAEAFLEPYMMMFGEVDMDTLSIKCGEDKEDDHPGCPPGHWIVPITWVVYMLVSNVLIVNVLIAVFNGIYEEVDSIAVEVWMFQRFNFVMEFEQKPVLPPPLIIICHMISFLKFLWRSFFACICEEDLILESQLDEEVHPHIVMGNDHSLKSFLSSAEQTMVFDFEEEHVNTVADKEGIGATFGPSMSGGNAFCSLPSNNTCVDPTAVAACRAGMGGNDNKVCLQQIKLVIGDLHQELDGQKAKVDRLIQNLEKEREIEQMGNKGGEMTEENKLLCIDSAVPGISCVAGIAISTPSSIDDMIAQTEESTQSIKVD